MRMHFQFYVYNSCSDKPRLDLAHLCRSLATGRNYIQLAIPPELLPSAIRLSRVFAKAWPIMLAG
jgi:hypothetical protein